MLALWEFSGYEQFARTRKLYPFDTFVFTQIKQWGKILWVYRRSLGILFFPPVPATKLNFWNAYVAF